MYGIPLDHLQRLLVILQCYMLAINICMEFLMAKTNRKAFSLYNGILDFNISKCFTGEGYGLVVLEECGAKAILTGISLQDKGLCAAIICQRGLQKHVANLGFQVVKCLICGGVPVPYLLPEKGSFRCKGREEGLQVVN